MKLIVTENKKKKQNREARERESAADAKIVFELIDVRTGNSYFFRDMGKRDVAYDILLGRGILVKKSAETEKFHYFTHFYDYEIPELVKDLTKVHNK